MVLDAGKTSETMDDHAHGLLGPYENWMMDVGKFYDLPGLMLDQGLVLSCLAEFREPVDYDRFPTAQSVQFGNWSLAVKIPTLHKSKGFLAKFVPFLLMPAPGTGATHKLLNRDAQGLTDLFDNLVGALSGPDKDTQDMQVRLNFPIRNDTLNRNFSQADAATATPDPAVGGGKPKVIVAIIDMGIPFAHANFRHTGTKNTRVDYCWAQSAPVNADGSDDVLFGREFTREQIDGLVKDHHGDEDAIYAEAGLLSEPGAPPMPLARMHAHGAHVMDGLAGNWDAATAAEVRIIAVDLPASSVWETSGFGKDMFVVSALHYIFERARRIALSYQTGHLPLVINLSYGYSGGPHDGSGLIEDAMAELVNERNQSRVEGMPAPTVIVMPSGNMFQDRLFAQITDAHFVAGAGDEKVATLQWFAPPCDRTSSYLEFWYPSGTALQDIRIEVTPPDRAPLAEFRARADADHFATNLELDGAIIGQFTIDQSRKFNADARLRATIITAPSEAPARVDLFEQTQQVHAPSPAGIWTVRFIMPSAVRLPQLERRGGAVYPSPGIECRIQRDTSYGQGNTGAQQGYFIDAASPRYDSMGKPDTTDRVQDGARIRRFGSMNGMATSPTTLVVGGHVISSEQATIYSSAGATRQGIGVADSRIAGDGGAFGQPVHISAPAERSAFAPGIVAAGTRSGVSVAFRGTSSSAPQVARQLATLLMKNPAFDVPGFLDLLATDAQVKPVELADDSPAGKRRLGRFLLSKSAG